MTVQLRAIALREKDRGEGYPFCVPVVEALTELRFEAPVTCLVGENGSGKSTLLEAIGVAADLPLVGGETAARDRTLKEVRRLARALRLTWTGRTHRGFFFRAEDFFRFAQRMHREMEEMESLRDEYAERFKDRPTALALTVGTASGQARAIENRYGRDLHENSHGESFLKFFQSRFVPQGLYLMDEPEASLSPQRQLALLGLMAEIVAQGGQFLVATHSPLLMAYPGAVLLDLDESPPEPAAWEDLEHVSLTRSFLENPERFLRHLAPGAGEQNP